MSEHGIISVFVDPSSRYPVDSYFIESWTLSQESGHQPILLCQSPAEADFILFIEPNPQDYYKEARLSRSRLQYPHKCVVISEQDKPPFFMRGIYSSASYRLSHCVTQVGWGYPNHIYSYPNPMPDRAGGTPEMEWLCSFIGRSSHPLRRRIFCRLSEESRFKVVDTTHAYDHFDRSKAQSTDEVRRMDYWMALFSSKFALCPRGLGTSSIRLFEAMEAGVCPVIVSDDWLPPPGIPWDKCSIRIREKDVDHLPAILRRYESNYRSLGLCARQQWEEQFDPHSALDRLYQALSWIQQEGAFKSYASVSLTESAVWLWRMRKVLSRAKFHAQRITRLSAPRA